MTDFKLAAFTREEYPASRGSEGSLFSAGIDVRYGRGGKLHMCGIQTYANTAAEAEVNRDFILEALTKLQSPPPDEFGAELYQLLIKAARRCAYDLRHCAAFVPPESIFDSSFFEERANHWLEIFEPDGVKDYRHRLHREISTLELHNEGYKRLLKEHGIEDTVDDRAF
jgi:hypothetical protein